MGLNQHWFQTKTPEEKAKAILTGEDPEARTEIGYFRKFYDLNDFLGEFYPDDVADFNIRYLEITPEILAAMEEFGREYHFTAQDTARYYHKDLIPGIKQAMAEGRTVYYWPWW